VLGSRARSPSQEHWIGEIEGGRHADLVTNLPVREGGVRTGRGRGSRIRNSELTNGPAIGTKGPEGIAAVEDRYNPLGEDPTKKADAKKTHGRGEGFF